MRNSPDSGGFGEPVTGSGCDYTAFSCDDNNPCTTDVCNGSGGCSHPNNMVACLDDGNVCTTDACSGGVCGHKSNSLACPDDGNVCTTDKCAATVCGHTANTAACESDGNACTIDVCAVGACVHVASTAACTDGNMCTINDVCAGGVCIANLITCNDNNACTNDACDPSTGCVFTPDGGFICDDGNACTQNDACAGSVCAGTNSATGSYCAAGSCDAGACVACPKGMVSTSVDGEGHCAFDYPIWGNRSTSPVGVYTAVGDGTVSDSQTALVWQQTQSNTPVTWPAAQSYCDGLVLANQTDWRLPTAAELETLVEYALPAPNVDGAFFPTVDVDPTWTSVPRPGNADHWIVEFTNSASIAFSPPNLTAKVHCVRGGKPASAAPAQRFVASVPNVVVDSATGLSWQQLAASSTYTWANAQSYCSSLSLNGTGWRLPNVRELGSLLDRSNGSSWIDATAFPAGPAQYIWSATPVEGNAGQVWGVDFSEGAIYGYFASHGQRVRCVR